MLEANLLGWLPEGEVPLAHTFRTAIVPSRASEIPRDGVRKRQVVITTEAPSIAPTTIEQSSIFTTVTAVFPELFTSVVLQPDGLETLVYSVMRTSIQTSVIIQTPTAGFDQTSGSVTNTPSETGAASEPGTPLSNEARIGIGVGVSLGGLLLIGVAVYFFVVSKKKRKGKSEQSWDKAELSGESGRTVHEAGGKERPHEIDSTARAELNGEHRAELEGSGPLR